MNPSDGSRPFVSWAALLVRTREGDLEAFEELVRACERQVLRIALRITGNLEDAQDVTQNAFVRLYRSRDRFDDQRPLEGWLFRIVVNEARTLLERRRGRETSPLDEHLAGSLPAPGNPEESYAGRDLQDKIDRALGTLSPRLKTVFVLRDLEGMSTEQVAEVLGCRPVTVRRHSTDARARVQTYLRKHYPGLLGEPSSG